MTLRLILLLSLVTASVVGQDMHFSQVTNFPLLINPALAGSYDAKYRASFSFRNQNLRIPNTAFSGVYNTAGISAEAKIFEELSDQNTWTVGFMALSDYAGSGSLATNQVMLASSYSLSLDRYGQSFLSIGGQVGFISRRIFSDDLLFESQVSEFEFDPRLPNLEPFLDGSNRIVPSMNFGIVYQQQLGDQVVCMAGFSLYNVNKPKDFFISTSNINVYSRANLHGGLLFNLDESSKLYPSIIYMKQGEFSQTNVGMSYSKQINDELAIIGGIRSRLGDAFILAGGLNYNNLAATISYDYTTSSLSKANKSIGALELNLTYLLGENKTSYSSNKMYCPSF